MSHFTGEFAGVQACADKLDRELALYGTPPVFPEEAAAEVVRHHCSLLDMQDASTHYGSRRQST